MDIKNIPQREGCETIIHECKKCIYGINRGKAYLKCDVQLYRKQGWCYTYKDKDEK